jgi:hypothetical protein
MGFFRTGLWIIRWTGQNVSVVQFGAKRRSKIVFKNVPPKQACVVSS